MSAPASERRKKNLGFKPEGEDKKHDLAYKILESLPRRAASSFVVCAIYNYVMGSPNGSVIRYGSGNRHQITVTMDSNMEVHIQTGTPNNPQESFLSMSEGEELENTPDGFGEFEEPEIVTDCVADDSDAECEKYKQLFNGYFNCFEK
ncbi:hypothetical protein H9X81_10195 [Hydrogenoanaerobacterium saccharovorans]|uniref:Uncharacterized protein n=1 Tax=Hydrogenoanaerobacterium saccharovorans TaxID=474960 RepID=A0ABS2GNG9_9FIRM|nr:hypothetical protein [Hydrogenoanaerobacterium saccharovorans]MBM6924052.1 hypothetical protein [Hydrogenoanaerobacterium saccharovorans]